MQTNHGYKFKVLVLLAAVVLAGNGRSAFAYERPVAEAGLPRYAATDPVRLNGSGSYDPDQSGPLTYVWKQVSGPAVVMTGADTATPTVSGPLSKASRGGLLPGPFPQMPFVQECVFELVVSDGELTSAPDTVKVIIVPTFPACTMKLENAPFDPDKPTVLYFHGGTSEQTGGGTLGRPAWSQKANIISFPSYVGDSGTFGGAMEAKSYQRPGDMIIVYLSAAAPEYRQPIQTLGWSIGGLLALDVARRLNLTYADPRYAVNHACLLDPSAWVMGTPEFQRRVAELLAHPVAGEQCWVASLEAANASVCPGALNIVFAVDHALPPTWYVNSLETMESAPFNQGVLGGAYWSVLGPGRNLQLAPTPGVQTYKFRWIGTATQGQMEFYNQADHPGRLPEPVALGALVPLSDVSGAVEGAVLSCDESENAVGYQLLFGADPYRVMDYRVISDTPTPPMEVLGEFPSGQTWWTVRVRDTYGSTIHADPIRLDRTSLPQMSVRNAQTGKRYVLIGHALREAHPGDVILLEPALYQENLEFSGKEVAVTSLDPNNPVVVADTIIRGRGNGPTVTFAGTGSTGCLLAGLTIQSTTVGISCRDAAPTIRRCRVECPAGIAVEFWLDRAPTLIDCTLLGPVKESGDPGLLAQWKFDETTGTVAADSIGTRNGALMGNPLWQPTGGKKDGALQFTGSFSFVTVPFICDPSAGPFTVVAWVKDGAPGQVILAQKNASNWLRAAATTGALGTELKSPRGGSLVSTGVITDGAWHRVGLVWDGTYRILYLDGTEVARDTTAVASLTGSTDGLVIGGPANLAPGAFWSGLIDDVRVYNRAIQP